LKILIRIFRTIWGLWHVLWFSITVILFAPFHIILAPIFGEKAAKFLMFMTYRIGAYFILVPCLHFIKNHGREKIDKNRSYLIVGNHHSNLDFYVHPHSAPVYIRVLVKKELERIPLFGSVMKAIAVSVERGDRDSAKRSFATLKEKLDKGYSIFIYPEGTRNREQEMFGEFKKGAFRMAIEHELPLLISTIGNSRKLQDLRNGFDACPGIVHVYWEEAIETKGMTMDDIPALMERTKEVMRKNILKHQKQA
jgi:1-acyl-sn-glycerol-3-phosphate acyltransferase